MEKIIKTVLTITVLHNESDDIATWDLDEIFGEMNEGCIIGGPLEVTSSQEVSSSKVCEELKLLGNDGSFFDDI